MFLHAMLMQPDVPRDRRRMTRLLEDTARAFDWAAVDDPNLAVGQFGDEAGPPGADAREARHLRVAVLIQASGKLVGQAAGERATRAGEDQRHCEDLFLHASTV